MPPEIEAPPAPETPPPQPGTAPGDKPPGEKPKPAEKKDERAPKDERTFIERMTGRKPKADAAPADSGKPKPATKKVKKLDPPTLTVTPAAPVDYTKIAEATGRGVVEAMAKQEQEKAAKAKPPGHEDLTSDQQETVAVLERMAKDYPEEAGKPAQFVEGLKKARDYQKTWEREHPGEKFDHDDEQHDAFFESIEVDWNDQRFNRALARIEAEKLAEAQTGPLKTELAQLRARDQWQNEARTHEPVVIANRDKAAKGFFEALGDNFTKVLGPRGEQNREEVDRLLKEDKLNIHAFKAAENVEVLATEITKLSLVDRENRPLFPYNPKNGLHQFIGDFVNEQQQAMKSQPVDEQRDEHGRRFLTVAEFEQLPPDQRQYYWHFTTDDLIAIYSAREADRVKNIISDFETTAAARGFVKKDGEKPATGRGSEAAAAANPPRPKPKSPSGSVEPLMSHPPRGGPLAKDSQIPSFEQRWLGRA